MDSAGLAAAYAAPQGFSQTGTTMYIRGTDWAHGVSTLASDLRDDMLLPMSGITIPGVGITGTRATTKYKQAKRWLDAHPDTETIVGHSLGAAVAEDLGQARDIPYRTYSQPAVTWTRDVRHRRRRWDPIAGFDFGASTTDNIPIRNPHGFS